MTLNDPNLFGKQRIFGTIGSGITVFILTRIYSYFKYNFIYLLSLIISTILCIISTSFIPIKLNKLNDKNNEKKNLLNINLLSQLLKQVDVIIFILKCFFWGASFAAIDPV